MPEQQTLIPSTPDAAAAVAQSRWGRPESPSADRKGACSGKGMDFIIAPRVFRAVRAKPYERESGKPVYRPLRIFTLDPAISRLEGSVALVNVPYEPLKPGPSGEIFVVDNYDGHQKLRYSKVDLEHPEILIRNGRDPSPSDHMFHQQMVYAVSSMVYSAFKAALGRDIAWGFEEQTDDPQRTQLLLRPHACNEQNAFYDKTRGEISFGYYKASEKVSGFNLPCGYIFTCLSHDIIAHELTHALLDGLRSHFTHPSGHDVLAFHESLADLVAIFQRFSYGKVLEAAIRKSQGNLGKAELLTDIARQFGHTAAVQAEGPARALRRAVDDQTKPKQYGEVSKEPHELGSVLTSAVFEAFLTVFKRKTERYFRLASNGTGELPPGEIPADLQAILARRASKLAGQFLNMCIRAIDYCPPVDLEFGEFLRAVVTADYDLVPDDPWNYREAWIDAFQRRGIYPSHVSSLSEDALLWRQPRKRVGNIEELTFARLQFEGDPGRPAGEKELKRQAYALGSRIVSDPDFFDELGFVRPNDPRLGRDTVEPICVESIRSSRRIGPSGQIVFDLVAEVTQRRNACDANGAESFPCYGGATLILSPRGEIRYLISKSVISRERVERQREFMRDDIGRRFWHMRDGQRVPHRQVCKQLHSMEMQDGDTRRGEK